MAELTYEEATKKVAESAKHPRVTKDFIESSIAAERYLKDGTTTICVLELVNGFKVFGHSTPADERNYMEDVGRGYARDNAFRQLWPLFGFSLRNEIAGLRIEILDEEIPSEDPVERELAKERRGT